MADGDTELKTDETTDTTPETNPDIPSETEPEGDGSTDNGDETLPEIDVPEEPVFDFLAVTKILLGIESDISKDQVLQIYIDITKQSILNYCNLSELPPALFYTTCEIVADSYREANTKNSSGAVVGNVSSISEDGRTVSFASSIKENINNKISKMTELNRYKKLYRI